jgi:methionine synthase II (cobalamin-independent)
MINNAINYGAIAVIVLLLSAVGFQTLRLDKTRAELKLALEISSEFQEAARVNYEILARVKTDFNASLSACYKDYKSLASSFDDYRQTIAKSSVLTATLADKTRPLEQNATCVIGGNNEIVNALNAFN